MARDVLLEIGVEELPVSFLRFALEAMPALFEQRLAELRVDAGAVSVLGTPRRLTLHCEGVAEAQNDLSELVVGPPTRIALDEDGKLTKAGRGFLRKQGLAEDGFSVIENDKGAYLAFQREEKGRPTEELLPALLEGFIPAIPFPKAMRWGDGDLAFGRPIQWLVALFGQDLVPLTVAGIESGHHSLGHRFLAPGPVEIPDPGGYEEAMEAAHVIVSPEERRRRVEIALAEAAKALGGELVEDAFLLEECSSLVEAPFVVPGGFDETFLDLPAEVIVSVMRDHQRYFAVRDGKGKLLPHYLNVVNTARDPETIRRGNDRVLRARLQDARFFVDEDRKVGLDPRVEELDRIVFIRKIGTVGDKVKRLADLAFGVVGDERVRTAARLAKADLATLIVGEFPELQGAMGRFYALEENADPDVADAIRDHYLPQGKSDVLPAKALSAALGVADRIDTLVGCFGLGLTPTGSADPYALRRAALGIIRIAEGGLLPELDLRGLVDEAYDRYPGESLASKSKVAGALDEFFRARLRAYYQDRYPGDVVVACLGAWPGKSIRDFGARLEAIDAFRKLPAFDALAIAFKRAHNIAKEAERGELDRSLLEAGPEVDLVERFEKVAPLLDEAPSSGAYREAFFAVAEELRAPIDLYFDKVLVMHEDPAIRENRLRLMARIADSISQLAHVHELAS
ncbi:MAG: glycine--tRNA ligase subunit beta [Myxococcota bacterium]